jgi:hypothetical protein
MQSATEMPTLVRWFVNWLPLLMEVEVGSAVTVLVAKVVGLAEVVKALLEVE